MQLLPSTSHKTEITRFRNYRMSTTFRRRRISENKNDCSLISFILRLQIRQLRDICGIKQNHGDLTPALANEPK